MLFEQSLHLQTVIADKMCEAKSERECEMLYEVVRETRSRLEAAMDDHSIHAHWQEELQQVHDPERRQLLLRELGKFHEATDIQRSRAEVVVERYCPAPPTVGVTGREYHIVYRGYEVTKDFETNEDRYYTP